MLAHSEAGVKPKQGSTGHDIGIPRERRPSDSRMASRRPGQLLTADGHHCYVEEDAVWAPASPRGLHSRPGPKSSTRARKLRRADLYSRLRARRPRSWLDAPARRCWLLAHRFASPDNLEVLQQKKITSIATKASPSMTARCPCAPVSMIAGAWRARGGVIAAQRSRARRPARGRARRPACPGCHPGCRRVAPTSRRPYGPGAQVFVLDRNLSRLEALVDRYRGIITMVSHPSTCASAAASPTSWSAPCWCRQRSPFWSRARWFARCARARSSLTFPSTRRLRRDQRRPAIRRQFVEKA